MGHNFLQGLVPEEGPSSQKDQIRHGQPNQKSIVSLQSTVTPSDCSSSWTLSPIQFPTTTILIQNAIQQLLDTSCFPNSFTAFGRFNLGPIYDSGFCPDGYTTVATPAASTNDGTTTARCCQNEFQYTSSNEGGIPLEGCTSIFTGSTSVAAVSFGGQTTTSTSTTGLLTMWGKPLFIAFVGGPAPPPQPTATTIPPIGNPRPIITLATTASSTATSSPALTSESSFSATTSESSQPVPVLSGSSNTEITLATNTITRSIPTLSSAQAITSAPNTPSSTSHKESHSTHLSSGAKTGISFGVLLGLALLALLALFLLRRRRRHSRENFTMQYPSPSQNPLTDAQPLASERMASIPSLMIPNTEQLQPRRSWRMPTRLPSWGSRRANQMAAAGVGEREMQEAPVSPVSAMSRPSSRGSRASRGMSLSDGRNLESKGDMDVPVSPISPAR